MATTSIQGLSPKAKENLQRNTELRQKDSKFIKIEPGQKKTLKFNAEKIEQVEAEFNGKKSMRFRYTVIEEGSNSTDQEKYLEVGKRTSEDIDAFLAEGATRLKVQRFGSGIDTRYHVTSTWETKSTPLFFEHVKSMREIKGVGI